MIVSVTAAAQSEAQKANDVGLLSYWNWALLFAYAFAGWVMAHLKTAVTFASGTLEAKASIVSDLVASFATGVGLGLYVMLEYVLMPGSTTTSVVAYFVAAVGAYGGKKILDAIVEGLQTAARNFVSKNPKP